MKEAPYRGYPYRDVKDIKEFLKRVRAAKKGWRTRGKRYERNTPLYRGDK